MLFVCSSTISTITVFQSQGPPFHEGDTPLAHEVCAFFFPDDQGRDDHEVQIFALGGGGASRPDWPSNIFYA